jgi:hypothetical protein
VALQVPLPWERLLWSGRSAFPHGPRARYLLTDLRLVRSVYSSDADEILLDDIADIRQTHSRLDRLLGTSTLVVQSRRRAFTIELRGVRRGAQLAAVLDLLSGESEARLDDEAVRAALRWDPRGQTTSHWRVVASLALVLVAIFGVAVGLHGRAEAVVFPPDDPISPGGEKRPRADIVRFMEQEVLPWARVALGPIKGGPDRVTCLTCHGLDAEARKWRMPAVAKLPQPDLRNQGWETFGGMMDTQMRNAIYGYVAEPEKQTRAAYMREVVMPGMARVLRRPAYDFTRTYEYNRTRLAFGCYHCHQVK